MFTVKKIKLPDNCIYKDYWSKEAAIGHYLSGLSLHFDVYNFMTENWNIQVYFL